MYILIFENTFFLYLPSFTMIACLLWCRCFVHYISRGTWRYSNNISLRSFALLFTLVLLSVRFRYLSCVYAISLNSNFRMHHVYLLPTFMFCTVNLPCYICLLLFFCLYPSVHGCFGSFILPKKQSHHAYWPPFPLNHWGGEIINYSVNQKTPSTRQLAGY